MLRLEGSLDLTCSRDHLGRTYLSRQAFNVPFHISKPYWTGETLLIQVVNPTAGLFCRDRLFSRIRMEPGTSALVTNPSANRVHVADSDRSEVHLHFEIGEGAWLDYSPAILIPQAGSRYWQTTRVDFAKGGAGFFLESMAPGRVARGELFEFESIEWETNVCYDGQLILRERYSLNQGNGSLAAFQKPVPNAFFAGGFIVSEDLQNIRSIAEDLREISGKDLLIGLSPVEPFLWSLRILSANSIQLKRCVKSVRNILSSFIPGIVEQTRTSL